MENSKTTFRSVRSQNLNFWHYAVESLWTLVFPHMLTFQMNGHLFASVETKGKKGCEIVWHVPGNYT